MPDYREAVEVADIARDLIRNYHGGLADAKIIYLFRDKAPKSKGKVTLGAAKKASGIEDVLSGADFIIWIAEDEWLRMDMRKRRALVDHELSHCGMDENGK